MNCPIHRLVPKDETRAFKAVYNKLAQGMHREYGLRDGAVGRVTLGHKERSAQSPRGERTSRLWLGGDCLAVPDRTASPLAVVLRRHMH